MKVKCANCKEMYECGCDDDGFIFTVGCDYCSEYELCDHEENYCDRCLEFFERQNPPTTVITPEIGSRYWISIPSQFVSTPLKSYSTTSDKGMIQMEYIGLINGEHQWREVKKKNETK